MEIEEETWGYIFVSNKISVLAEIARSLSLADTELH